SITSITNTLRSLIIYSGDFYRLSTSYVIRALVIVISQAVLAFNNTINGLIYGLLLGEVIYSGLLHYFIKKSIKLPKLSKYSFLKVPITEIFTKYRAFSLYGSILELTSVVIFYGPIFIFSYFFNHNLIGQYSFIARFIWPPIILIATSCSNALYFHFKEIDNDKLKTLTLKATVLGIIILLISPIFAWLGKEVINLFLKVETWKLVADFGYFTILTAISYMASIGARAIIRFKHLQKYQLIIDILFIFGLAFALLIYMNYSSVRVLEILKLYSISYLIYNFVLIASIAFFICSKRVIKRDGGQK
ncbi:translocase, partial [Acinetobacter baumannii]